MFVLMLIHGHALTSILPDKSAEPRFWYWFGSSGRRYIHSVYPVGGCPPLPGAVFIAFKRTGTLRTALAVGRFSLFWDMSGARCLEGDADEVHVHLLARDDRDAEVIAADLARALEPSLNKLEQEPVPPPAFPAGDRECQARADAQRC